MSSQHTICWQKKVKELTLLYIILIARVIQYGEIFHKHTYFHDIEVSEMKYKRGSQNVILIFYKECNKLFIIHK